MVTNHRLGCIGLGLILSLSCAKVDGELSGLETPNDPAPSATQTSVLPSSASAQPTGNPTPTGSVSAAGSTSTGVAPVLSGPTTTNTGDGSQSKPDGGLVDASPDGGSVGHDAAAGPPPACTSRPCVTEASAHYSAERLAVAFAGWGTSEELLRVQLRPTTNPEDTGHYVYASHGLSSARFHPDREYGAIRFENDGSFSGYWVAGFAAKPDSVRVFAEAAASADAGALYLEVPVTAPAPKTVAVDALCDLEALLLRCPDTTLCDLRDGTPEPVCQVPAVECDATWNVESLTLEGASGNVESTQAAEVQDYTFGSCSMQRGDLGEDDVFRFVPETAGTYRISFVGEAATLFVRSYCTLPTPHGSELGCANNGAQVPRPEDTASLEVVLQANIPVFVFVEGAWTGGGPYELVVETL
jgi:hypothetical protein